MHANESPDEGHTELREFLHGQERRLHQFPRAALLGTCAGLVGVLFRVTLTVGERLRTAALERMHSVGGWAILSAILAAALGSYLAVWLVRRFAPEAAGSGIPYVKAVLYRLESMKWRTLLPVKFASGALGITSGLSLGREGPTIQMGSALGEMLSSWFSANERERLTLIAAGAGAGLASAFNAPLAGMVFVLEEVQRDFTPSVFAASLIASATADIVTRLVTGQLPIYRLPVYPSVALSAIYLFPLLGVVMGLLGVLFNRALLGTLNLFGRTERWPRGSAGVLVGALAGAVAWFVPDAVGGGRMIIDRLFDGGVSTTYLVVLFPLCLILTVLSYGSGAAGGIFAPMLMLGSIGGLLFGRFVSPILPSAIGAPVFAVVGMAAYFSATVRAPLTGIVLLLEMTESYNQMLPLLLACMAAYATAEALGDRPVYEAILERDLLRPGRPNLKSAIVLELGLEPDSPFDGQRVGDLDLGEGCLVISVRRGLNDLVATKQTVLAGGDRVTLVVGPESAATLPKLRQSMKAGTSRGPRG